MSDNKNVLIEVRDLCKSFDHVNVLNGISTTISQGEVVAIIGPSGCGAVMPAAASSGRTRRVRQRRRTVGMRKIYVSALHESSGKTNLRFHSF